MPAPRKGKGKGRARGERGDDKNWTQMAEESSDEEWAKAPTVSIPEKEPAKKALASRCAYRRKLQSKAAMCSQNWLDELLPEERSKHSYFLQERVFFRQEKTFGADLN